MNKIRDRQRLIIAGDFNSQVSNKNLATEESALIGKYAAHDTFNENGLQMRLFINLYSFAIRSTLTNANSSFLYTWTNGVRRSQIDHILTWNRSSLYLKRMQCTSFTDSDHKALLCSIVEDHTAKSQPSSNKSSARIKLDIDVKLLKHDKIKKRFKDQFAAIKDSEDPSSSLNEKWLKLKKQIHNAASKTLRPSRLPVSKKCRQALALVKKYTFWRNRSDNPKYRYKLQEANEHLRKTLRECKELEIKQFFEDLQQYPAGERINRTYQYLKNFKKKSLNRNSNIRLSDWVPECSEDLLIPELLPESSDDILMAPPSKADIKCTISQLKNGKATGVDELHSEFFKYGSEEMLEELHCIISKVWKENQLPDEWKHVVLVPIPKVKRPNSISDYRKICLSCTAYKVYASWILEKLQLLMKPIGVHQAAFLAGRSTIDHIFVLQRLLQERWNEGKSLILMSLDLEKAFDRVSLTSLPAILKG